MTAKKVAKGGTRKKRAPFKNTWLEALLDRSDPRRILIADYLAERGVNFQGGNLDSLAAHMWNAVDGDGSNMELSAVTLGKHAQIRRQDVGHYLAALVLVGYLVQTGNKRRTHCFRLNLPPDSTDPDGPREAHHEDSDGPREAHHEDSDGGARWAADGPLMGPGGPTTPNPRVQGGGWGGVRSASAPDGAAERTRTSDALVAPPLSADERELLEWLADAFTERVGAAWGDIASTTHAGFLTEIVRVVALGWTAEYADDLAMMLTTGQKQTGVNDPPAVLAHRLREHVLVAPEEIERVVESPRGLARRILDRLAAEAEETGSHEPCLAWWPVLAQDVRDWSEDNPERNPDIEPPPSDVEEIWLRLLTKLGSDHVIDRAEIVARIAALKPRVRREVAYLYGAAVPPEPASAPAPVVDLDSRRQHAYDDDAYDDDAYDDDDDVPW